MRHEQMKTQGLRWVTKGPSRILAVTGVYSDERGGLEQWMGVERELF